MVKGQEKEGVEEAGKGRGEGGRYGKKRQEG
jgi:hypothetical protein